MLRSFGYFSAGVTCAVCDHGTEPSERRARCNVCRAGYAGKHGECNFCQRGEEPSVGRERCVPCPSTHLATTGGCKVCLDGQRPDASGAACELCEPGFAGTGGACLKCSAGSQPSPRAICSDVSQDSVTRALAQRLYTSRVACLAAGGHCSQPPAVGAIAQVALDSVTTMAGCEALGTCCVVQHSGAGSAPSAQHCIAGIPRAQCAFPDQPTSWTSWQWRPTHCWAAARTRCVACALGSYSTDGVRCERCPLGALCEGSGATLSALRLRRGFYRSTNRSIDVRRCPDAAANCTSPECDGGLMSGCLGEPTQPCVDGLTGHYCSMCSASSRPRALPPNTPPFCSLLTDPSSSRFFSRSALRQPYRQLLRRSDYH